MKAIPEIKKAVFVKSSASVKDSPKAPYPEFAFIGRSNVGKSSLINMLCNNSSLARVSATPGKTININHYLVNDSWYMVDLPGYGYARRSKSLREEWEKVMHEYFSMRENLQYVFVLIDSRIPPQQIDIAFINRLGEMGVPLSIIFTKTDKNTQTETAKNIRRFNDELLKFWEELPVQFKTSATEKRGRGEVLEFISATIKEFNKNK